MPCFCPPLREVVADRRVINLIFLFSTPLIPLIGGQNGAKTLLLSSLEGGGQRPEGEKPKFSFFHPLDPPRRGTKWCKYPQKKGAPFSAPPDKIFFIDLEPSRFFNLKRSNANLMAVGKDIYIVTARDECSVIIPVNGHIDFIVHIIYRSPGRVNNLLPLVFE